MAPSRLDGCPKQTEVVIVGNGPSSLILSYILHGHIPYYDLDHPHPDPLLHRKLKEASKGNSPLLPHDMKEIEHLTEHFPASNFSYSSQSLPVNALLDALRRPAGEDERCEVAEYLALYPTAVGIEDSICSGQRVYGVHRQGDSFYITSHNLLCRYLVLATGALTEDKPPPDPLKPLAQWPIPDQMVNPVDAAPILVIGSGFSAADAIISTAPTQKLIHIFRWDPIHNPSPLAAGHSMVYPMSSAIYRLMRAAGSGSKIRIKDTAKDSPMISFLRSRDWAQIYEGIPNATVTNVEIHESRDGSTGGTRCATVTILQEDGSTISREVSCLVYAIGRMGRLDYLDDSLYEEIVDRGCVSPKRSSKPSQAAADSMASALERNKSMKYVTGSTLRRQAMEDLEVAPRVFIIGSLVGDSLVRYADGSCVYTASRIMHDRRA
ncbi:hypothetical protein AAP_04034 [Ascosphaera apis ARSEF 7405]|uniref:Uncharacterized protein n=1 Tax=Ascosphaera apis ARSEF 7405 TaxID=392613 RepID=A0A167XH32_9EURO|nr:hypothetical protein AAP_04034 [Ascosphaera apis ARSEF 7405]